MVKVKIRIDKKLVHVYLRPRDHNLNLGFLLQIVKRGASSFLSSSIVHILSYSDLINY